jgi:hypothetical protein
MRTSSECKIDSHLPTDDGSQCDCGYFSHYKPNTKEYLRLHKGYKPWDRPDIGWMEQLVRYHISVAAQLRKDIEALKEVK